jgi:hypothetical protein
LLGAVGYQSGISGWAASSAAASPLYFYFIRKNEPTRGTAAAVFNLIPSSMQRGTFGPTLDVTLLAAVLNSEKDV